MVKGDSKGGSLAHGLPKAVSHEAKANRKRNKGPGGAKQGHGGQGEDRDARAEEAEEQREKIEAMGVKDGVNVEEEAQEEDEGAHQGNGNAVLQDEEGRPRGEEEPQYGAG